MYIQYASNFYVEIFYIHFYHIKTKINHVICGSSMIVVMMWPLLLCFL